MSSLADRIGFFLGTHGPSLTIDTACSSTLTALATAVAFLRKGDCDTALVVTASLRFTHRHLLMMQVCTFIDRNAETVFGC
jgi:acyl transferase domain-containing protein